MRKVVILGSTGSIGVSTLSVLAEHPQQYQVLALTAACQTDKLFAQCMQFQPRYAAMVDIDAAYQLKQLLQQAGSKTEVLAGAEALCQLASDSEADIVMAAIVGAAGLLPTLAAVEQGKTVLLANKEALVMSGELFIKKVQQHQAILLPIDSEHNAIFQCLPAALQQHSYSQSIASYGISKLLLTGSGGPFLTTPLAEFEQLTPSQAVAHPNWSMGAKISVDSATMMNKGLEFIEARWLFNCQPDDIEVVIHPQSIIHSMVQYSDGSVLAQLGQPDMRTPIAHALAFPNRMSSPVPPLSFKQMRDFTFSEPEPERYPNLYLAIAACQYGQGATTALNAANEIAVAAFLQQKIRFTDIHRVNAACLEQFAQTKVCTLEQILQLDQSARHNAEQYIRKHC
ncbi:1-deoxy-D-xylulose-5-phosphate reductoisomerase [Rheinheimera salexigens]|uniref:1-deoxy-D-xylulose 5-phosphate reductoisomerase n=1 Tax=Rheinheimera salexigens TaxID=1628148 RepID=A0A1E7Q945_9GAMM|nr:1-deoxy-D-xylulose-5-phosphate reductoisomerase [Rheinheimera salexigens]OEY70573.1 1-deoxy-D-xylulose-5-phosphate reductoisomerase [Rheinheimera salexigens]